MMKTTRLFAAATAIVLAAISISSCGDNSGAAASGSRFFGDVPGIYMKMMEKKSEFMERFKRCSSDDEVRKIQAEAEKEEAEFATKIEKAATALDGKTIEIESTPDFNVGSPVTLTFDGFRSKLDMTPQFRLSGDATAAKDYQSESAKCLSSPSSDISRYEGLTEHIYLDGFDDQGNEVFSSQVAVIPIKGNADGELCVLTGTPVQFETLTISKHNAEGCMKATTLKLLYK